MDSIFSLSSKKKSRSKLHPDSEGDDADKSAISSGTISAPNTNPSLNSSLNTEDDANRDYNYRSPTLDSYRSSSSIDAGRPPTSSSMIASLPNKRNSRIQSDVNSLFSGRSSQFSSYLGSGDAFSSEAGPSKSINDFSLGGIESSSSFNSGRSHSSLSSISKLGTSGISIKNVDSLSNAEIEEHFDIFVHSIAPGDAEATRLRALPLDNKRALLHSSALKQKQAAKRHGRTEKSSTSSPRAPVGHADDPPQAYIRKFLSGNVLHTDVSHLSVSLRTMPLE